jgi:peroxiredoxin
METLKQQNISIQQLKGKPALVVFWATSCPGCIKEMPHLVELYHQLHHKGLEIVGVAMQYDVQEQIEKLVKLRNIPYPITHDSNGKIAQAFGDVKLTPTTFLINPDGNIVRQKIGDIDFAKLRSDIELMLKG